MTCEPIDLVMNEIFDGPTYVNVDCLICVLGTWLYGRAKLMSHPMWQGLRTYDIKVEVINACDV